MRGKIFLSYQFLDPQHWTYQKKSSRSQINPRFQIIFVPEVQISIHNYRHWCSDLVMSPTVTIGSTLTTRFFSSRDKMSYSGTGTYTRTHLLGRNIVNEKDTKAKVVIVNLRIQWSFWVWRGSTPPFQCCGSGSESRSFYHQAKIVRKTLCFLLFCDFLMTFYLWKMM